MQEYPDSLRPLQSHHVSYSLAETVSVVMYQLIP